MIPANEGNGMLRSSDASRSRYQPMPMKTMLGSHNAITGGMLPFSASVLTNESIR